MQGIFSCLPVPVSPLSHVICALVFHCSSLSSLPFFSHSVERRHTTSINLWVAGAHHYELPKDYPKPVHGDLLTCTPLMQEGKWASIGVHTLAPKEEEPAIHNLGLRIG